MIQFKQYIAETISKATEIKKEELEGYIEVPKDDNNGDFAFPCFKLAKTMKKAPQIIAEEIKLNIGNVYKGDKDKKMTIKGRDLSTGLPSMIEISEKEIEESIRPLANEMVKEVKSVLEKTPPELSADIIEKGIVLTGGGALLKGFPELFEDELKVPIFIAESPLTCVAEGCGIMLENLNLIDK